MEKLLNTIALIITVTTYQTIMQSHQEVALPTYDCDTLENTFQTNKERGARMWIAHMTNSVTPEGYRARMTPESNPALMISEWIQDLYRVMGSAKEQLPLPEEVKNVLHDNYTDALIMNYASNSTEPKKAPLTIVELREMIAVHFMRIYHLIDTNYSPFSSDANIKPYDDSLLKLLYGLCELSLQRWTEHNLSRTELEELFERQYQALAQIAPALRTCCEIHQQVSMQSQH